MQRITTHILAVFVLLVTLSGTAHAVQHDMLHGNEAHFEHSCVQADLSADDTPPQASLPPRLQTPAPHLPHATAPHQASHYTQPARGPPAIL